MVMLGFIFSGGGESYLSPIGFYNYDVNCNGFEGDNIVVLNQKNIPANLVYSCVIGTGGLLGDLVVDAQRANLK